ncbi:uncharacterized protein LOC109526039 [Hippocampus comes]|uniref:uncharacterized protein LOC109526039 n=1 Tax=Hippocampus comes TaxID=109280 RepID=UPI00094DFE16|nr:PREDICTED: uncharacterized protein LOC109526039 [Hippocampus comes]
MNTGPAVGKFCVLLATLLLLVSSPCRASEQPPSAQWSAPSDEAFKNLTVLRRHRTCVENQQYHYQGLCCLNCQAGTFVQKGCERDYQQGVCSPCKHGLTYTEHSNGMYRCLPCTHCRQDEMETASCTTTSDTKCQCRAGTFCVPDQACEVCKRCAKCKAGEEEVKKCTHFSNTVCRKRDPFPTQTPLDRTPPTPTSPADIMVPVLSCLSIVVVVLAGLAAWCFVTKRCSFEGTCECAKSHCDTSEIIKIPIDESAPTAEECQNSRNAGLEGDHSRPESRPLLQETQAGMTNNKASPSPEDEDRGLGDSLPNTTSSSQTSLSAMPTAASYVHSPAFFFGPTSMCLPCVWLTDEMETASCTTTSDTKCQCRAGTFCVPDQACEVCKRCAKCKAGEEEVKKCTHFSNTVCRKRDPFPTQTPLDRTPPTPTSPADIMVPVLSCLSIVVVVLAGLAAWCFVTKRCSFEGTCECAKSHCDTSEIIKIPIDESAPTAEECQNSRNAGLEGDHSRPESRPLLQETQAGMTNNKASPSPEDEDRGLGDSLPNTTSSSQTSLSAMPTAASSGDSPASCRISPAAIEDPLQHRLLPLQESEKSLKKSFDLFDKYLDVRIHNKFFRMIGVSDNHIRLAENGAAGDKVYELLKNWMQRQGLKADINHLLQALLDLDQRRSAESIASEALRRGYYKHDHAP